MTMKDWTKKCKKHLEGRKPAVDILAILFGVGAWIGVNGVFVELPLLVRTAPEAWSLPSYMSVSVQLANACPLLYAICRKWQPKIDDYRWICCVLATGIVSAGLLAIFYKNTQQVAGEERSVALLVLVFFQALVGCTSSVLFLPFMRHYREIYLTTYFIGEGLSGFLPSMVALVQGVGGDQKCPNKNDDLPLGPTEPLFGPEYFFAFLCAALCVSFISFVLLNRLKVCRGERVPEKIPPSGEDTLQMEECDELHSKTEEENAPKRLSTARAAVLLTLIGTICAFSNGIFPSIQSYSCLPYGYRAYHLSLALSSMANPTACFLGIFLQRTSNRSIAIMSVVCSILIWYALTTSVMSPAPPLVDTILGTVTIVLVWIATVGLVSYIKLSITTVFRSEEGSWLFYCGCVSQFGSAIGSAISFALVNYTRIFVARNPCE